MDGLIFGIMKTGNGKEKLIFLRIKTMKMQRLKTLNHLDENAQHGLNVNEGSLNEVNDLL